MEDVGAKTFKYLYDFGDAWYHTSKVEKVFDEDPMVDLPFLLECSGHCLPEDVGGPDGYASLLAAYDDPSHSDQGAGSRFGEWHPEPINPTDPKMPDWTMRSKNYRRRGPKRRTRSAPQRWASLSPRSTP